MKKALIAVILAGGGGTRFWPLVTNKVLFPFFEKTFFDLAIRPSLPPEVTKAVIITSPEASPAYRDLKFSVPTLTVVQPEPRGMADALLVAATQIENASLLIILADDLVDNAWFSQVVRAGLKTKSFGIVTGWNTKKYFPGGYLLFKDKQVIGIKEKPGEGNEPSDFVNITGHYIAEANLLLDEIRRTSGDTDDIYEKALTGLMQKHQFGFLPYQGTFSTLKYPWQILDILNQLFARNFKGKVGKNVQIKNNVTLEGEIIIQDNVIIFENTKIIGPCYIGPNTIIGNNNLIRASHLGANCVTGFNTDISRSYIGSDCWFHANYIGDSVLESNISLGSGAVLANLRLDEGEISSVVNGQKINTQRNKLGAIIAKNVRVGVNASIMPAVKVGSNSFIGAGVVQARDLAENSFCSAKINCEVLRNKVNTSRDREEFRRKI